MRKHARRNAAQANSVSPLAFSHLLLGETIAPPHVSAAALVILGIVVLARPSGRGPCRGYGPGCS